MRALFRGSVFKRIGQLYRNDINVNCDVSRSWFIAKKYYCTAPKDSIPQIDNSLVENYIKFLTSAHNNNYFEFSKYLEDYDRDQIEEISTKLENIIKRNGDKVELELMLQDDANDEEMRVLIKEDLDTIKSQVLASTDRILAELLNMKERMTSSDVLFEVSAGVGGQEAMLFTQEIYLMYQRYFNYKGWGCDVVSEGETDLGGIRHATLLVSGDDVYNQMKFEGGVHRVQRVPKTERGGRLHTSTMKVVVLLQPSEIEVNINPKDLRIETCKSSGKGGQHVNTTDSAVRIVHIPTGIFSECQTQRSQLQNRESALKVLRSRLYEREENKIRQDMRSSRLLQAVSANRNEKIRTYNFKDDRITDHRIGQSSYNLESFLEGGHLLDDFISSLRDEHKKELLINRMKSVENKL